MPVKKITTWAILCDFCDKQIHGTGYVLQQGSLATRENNEFAPTAVDAYFVEGAYYNAKYYCNKDHVKQGAAKL